ncbi:MAG TPA: AI-2E family transporter, partial [Labilithrix sp.]|nr:AI-2E family transporter [Labilithrix sp.]
QLNLRAWADMASRYGADVWRAASSIAKASASMLLSGFVFVIAFYTFTVDGEDVVSWLKQRAPIGPRAFERFAAAFRETGRGLLVGAGGTALAQGLVATVTYVALGIPSAVVLGALTAVCALLPTVGTALVWAPLSLSLALTSSPGRAAILAIVGLTVISSIDNVLRPLLTRFGRLHLPAVLVLFAMLGGVAMFGAAGVLLGPLLVRFAVEALAIAKEDELFSDAAAASARPSEETDPS